MEARKFVPHYTVNDWESWEGNWELLDGTAFAMSPSPVYKHQKVSKNILFLLDEALHSCNRCESIAELDWQISADTIVRPDIMVLCGDKNTLLDMKRLEHRPEIAVEVLSEYTRRKDRDIKLALYEQQKVPFTILADPDTEKLEIYELFDNLYRLVYEGRGASYPVRAQDCLMTTDWARVWNY